LTFEDDILADFSEILSAHGDAFTIKSHVETSDSMGRVLTTDETSFLIVAWITDITKRDRKVHDLGLVVAGSRIVYFKNEYYTTSGGVRDIHTVKEGDIFVDRNSNTWRLTSILKEPFFSEQEIYKKGTVKNITLEGS